MHTGLSVDDGIVIDKSRMNREVHVRFRESLRVKVLSATRLRGRGSFSPSYSIAPGERTFYRVKVPNAPGSGKRQPKSRVSAARRNLEEDGGKTLA